MTKTLKELIEDLQLLVEQGTDENTPVYILQANGIQLSGVEKIEQGKTVIHIVESK